MRGHVRLLASGTAAAVLVLGTLTGCSGSAAGGGGSAPSSGTGAASSPASASPSAASPPAVATAPEGSAFVESASAGVRFALPDDWKVFDSEAITEGRDPAMVEELARTYDVSASQLTQIFGQMDLMVVGPVQKKFAPNVNVVANGLTKLPAATDLAAELEKVGARTGTARDATTPLGPAIVVPYDLTVNGNQVKGRSIVLEGPEGFVTVTVSHVAEKQADAITSTILSTVGPS